MSADSEKIFVRIGFTDIRVSLEDYQKNKVPKYVSVPGTGGDEIQSSFIGYETEDGEELNQEDVESQN